MIISKDKLASLITALTSAIVTTLGITVSDSGEVVSAPVVKAPVVKAPKVAVAPVVKTPKAKAEKKASEPKAFICRINSTGEEKAVTLTSIKKSLGNMYNDDQKKINAALVALEDTGKYVGTYKSWEAQDLEDQE